MKDLEAQLKMKDCEFKVTKSKPIIVNWTDT